MSTSQTTSNILNRLKGGLKPLNITCTSTNCNSGLHCFRQSQKMAKANLKGVCRDCGISLIDWKRLEKQDLSDIDYTFNSLRYEMIRHSFWHKEIDEKAIAHARRKGKILLEEAVVNRITKYIKSAVMPGVPTFDGRQTPLTGNIIFYGQHATGTCCRKCIDEWYGISPEEELTDQQIDYFFQLIMRYINERMPYLKEEPEKVPVKRKLKSN